MKGYYIHFEGRGIIGVSKKIDMQLKEFRKHYDMEEIEIKRYSMSVIRNGLALLPFFSVCWDYTEAYQRIEAPDFLYIRKAAGERSHYLFLKYVKKNFPNCKIIVEIPTYPYWKDAIRRITGLLLIKDFFNYYILYPRYIDRIVTFADDEKIFRVKTIRITNGVHVDDVPMIASKEDEKTIQLLAVAWISAHHGYERILYGLYEYYKKEQEKEVHLHFVGTGPQKEFLMNLTKKLGLQEHVFFYESKTGDELQNMYDMADIGISTLGFHREDLVKFSSLKAREYLAEGLPVVTEAGEDAFECGDKRYCCEFPADESVIDVQRIVDFYENLLSDSSRMELAKQIRQFAYKHVDNSYTMKPIFSFIDGCEDE